MPVCQNLSCVFVRYVWLLSDLVQDQWGHAEDEHYRWVVAMEDEHYRWIVAMEDEHYRWIVVMADEHYRWVVAMDRDMMHTGK